MSGGMGRRGQKLIINAQVEAPKWNVWSTAEMPPPMWAIPSYPEHPEGSAE